MLSGCSQYAPGNSHRMHRMQPTIPQSLWMARESLKPSVLMS